MKKNMNEPLVSIIVPVYNVEDYLERCINSLINQSYSNIEIVVVDDGSSDKSGLLCDKYKDRFDFIKVIHKDNAGLGLARNTGLEWINGEYVTFVDSDDWVSPNYIKNMYLELKKAGVDFCKGGFIRVKNEGEPISNTQYENKIYIGHEAKKQLLPRMIGSSPNAHDSVEMCVCGVLYNSQIIIENNIRFPSEREFISEDLVFNIDYMQFANGACTISALDYYYRVNNDSLSHRYRSDRLEASVFFYREIKKKLIKLGYDDNTLVRLNRCFFIYLRMSIVQEKKSIAPHGKTESIRKIKEICKNETVCQSISEYPIKQIGFKQALFLILVEKKQATILYELANSGLM